jgi:predicted aldo/keto reductase-like oxidoreductase
LKTTFSFTSSYGRWAEAVKEARCADSRATLGAMGNPDFTHRLLPRVGRKVHRLGLALNYGIDTVGFDFAVERGLNYFFFTALKTGHLVPSLKRVLKADREKYVVATGPSTGFFGGGVKRAAEAKLKELGTDYIDVFQLFWLGVGSAWTDGTVEALTKLREEGKVKTIGISIHDRERAGNLAETSPLDLFMIRYNAAHPGAERDIFPHLDKQKPAVVAYTATSWRKLLKRPGGWKGDVMTAGDCYRFCLSSPHVDVTLCGPKNTAQLTENLDALEKGPLRQDELAWMRDFGAKVHG